MKKLTKADIPPHILPIVEVADMLVAEGRTVHFKFTCLACGARQTFDEPNTLYHEGRCEECNHVSDVFDPKAKLNYLAIFSNPGGISPIEAFREILDSQIRHELKDKGEES